MTVNWRCSFLQVLCAGIVLSGIVGCSTTGLAPYELSRDQAPLFFTPNERTALRSQLLPDARLLALRILLSVEIALDDQVQRFRAVVYREAPGQLRVQLLPTTSLTVIDSFRFTRDGVKGEAPDEVLSARNIFTLIGDIREPEEFFTLLLGRLPIADSPPFGQPFFPVSLSKEVKKPYVSQVGPELIGSRDEGQEIILDRERKRLVAVTLSDRLRELPILRFEYGEHSFRFHPSIPLPETVTLHLLRREVSVQMKLLQAKILSHKLP
ncbi:hypothetical protein MRY87_00595 [bacterium]|nr:hypothetical protein [bacterium]